jgi:hypothetical protein
MSESLVQSKVRLICARLGWYLWRNNRGAFKDATGRWVRYGLGNDSKKFGDKVKSSDEIGWRKVVITQAMVGKTIAQFVSLECKPEGWEFNPNDEHEVAQKVWIDLVNKDGGYAAFISDPDQVI